MTGVNRERTLTRTQSPGWQEPLTVTPSMSMHEYDRTVSAGTSLVWTPTTAAVSVLEPSVPPGWTLVSRAISRAASETPLSWKTARPPVDDGRSATPGRS